MPLDANAIRVGPGIIYVAPLGTTEPVNLSSAWDVAWVRIGYTDAGSTWTFDQTFEDVMVAEELEPLQILQTARTISLAFAAAEITAVNMQRALNGGTITPSGAPPNEIITFEPPPAGTYTPLMMGWQADDNYERWVFRRCVSTGSIEIARRKAPDKATIPITFRATKPTGVQSFKWIHDANYTAA
jgi:hypothetical protein